MSNHAPKKKFITSEDTELIREHHAEEIDPEQIARRLGISVRNVKHTIRDIDMGITNHFTIEEDTILLQKLREGIEKPSILARFLPHKHDWMIRNRIKLFKRHGLNDQPDEMDDTDFYEF